MAASRLGFPVVGQMAPSLCEHRHLINSEASALLSLMNSDTHAKDPSIKPIKLRPFLISIVEYCKKATNQPDNSELADTLTKQVNGIETL